MFHITYSAPRNLDDSIMAEMARVDQALSIFNPISEISAINTGKCFRAGPYVSDVFEISRQVSALSDGAFDPTVRPLVDHWGVGPGAPPDAPRPPPPGITPIPRPPGSPGGHALGANPPANMQQPSPKKKKKNQNT